MDNQIFFFFYNLAHQSKVIDWLIIFTADFFPYIVILLAFLFLLLHHEILSKEKSFIALIKKWKEFFLVFFSGMLAWFLSFILKLIIHTERPFELFPKVISLFSESGYTFPSGHATFFMALAFAIYFNHKKAGYAFIIFALLIGVARIMAGVHFPIDILGGFVLGYFVAFFLKKI